MLFRSRVRTCLRCQEPFDSEHAGNRICPACTRYAQENLDVADPAVRPSEIALWE